MYPRLFASMSTRAAHRSVDIPIGQRTLWAAHTARTAARGRVACPPVRLTSGEQQGEGKRDQDVHVYLYRARENDHWGFVSVACMDTQRGPLGVESCLPCRDARSGSPDGGVGDPLSVGRGE